MSRKTLTSLFIVGANVAAGALVAATAVLAAPAFASGLGPATSYNPAIGAPASQRGVSALTVNAEAQLASARYDAQNRTADARRSSGSDRRAEVVGLNTVAPDHAGNQAGN